MSAAVVLGLRLLAPRSGARVLGMRPGTAGARGPLDTRQGTGRRRTCGIASAAGASGLARVSGGAVGPLALAAGAWIGAAGVPLMFAGLLPFLLAFLLTVVMWIVALAGALAPMLLVVFGSESMVNLAMVSPVVTLPLMVVMLLLVPLQRLAPRNR